MSAGHHERSFSSLYLGSTFFLTVDGLDVTLVVDPDQAGLHVQDESGTDRHLVNLEILYPADRLVMALEHSMDNEDRTIPLFLHLHLHPGFS